MSIFYRVTRISDCLYSIEEDLSGGRFPIFVYLVLGTRRAALIDTGLGTGDLRAAVSEISDLPVVVLHTHAHLDHVGADALFDELYLSPPEIELAREGSAIGYDASVRSRLSHASLWLADAPDELELIRRRIVPRGLPSYKVIDDGDLIDLGGLKLEAVATPGHTPGSLSYACNSGGFAFSGDGIADIHWFDRGGPATVEGFAATLGRFSERAAGVEKVYAAHIPEPFGLDLVDALRRAATAILSGSDDQVENADYQFLKHGQMRAHREGAATIYYDETRVREG
jgi:Zn-dependent hydrolases, including glyoxylases